MTAVGRGCVCTGVGVQRVMNTVVIIAVDGCDREAALANEIGRVQGCWLDKTL